MKKAFTPLQIPSSRNNNAKFVTGFTLLELMVVIIIIGVLASLGSVQYTRVIEKARRGEAAAILGSVRNMALIWNQEGHATLYPDNNYLVNELGLAVTNACDGQHYFWYTINSGSGQTTATRCIGAAGKQPGATAADTLTLDINGQKGGTVSW